MEGDQRFGMYLQMHGWAQLAINTNSDNMWLPTVWSMFKCLPLILEFVDFDSLPLDIVCSIKTSVHTLHMVSILNFDLLISELLDTDNNNYRELYDIKKVNIRVMVAAID